MNRKSRVAVIGLKGLPAFGGAASVGENIIENLKNEFEFTVYSISSHTILKTAEYNGFKQIVFRKLPFKKLNTIYYYILSTLHVLILGNYCLVHLHHSDAAFIIPLLKIRFPVLITTHGAFNITSKWAKFNFYFRTQNRFFVPMANIITCVSKKEQRIFSERYNLHPIYIPNGIPEIHISSVKEDYILFAAARIIESKGCHFLLDALRKIQFTGKVLIVGDFNQSQGYHERLKLLSTNLNCNFIDLIRDKSLLFNIISKAKLFIYPSMLEAMSMILLETASIGTPIICADIEGNTDIFSKDEVLFFINRDVDDLSEKISYALSNPLEMSDRANIAKHRLSKVYSWGDISKQYSQLYESLI